MSSRFLTGEVVVRVPATSANLGPGYDACGLALALHDVVGAEVVDGPLEILVEGEGAEDVPRTADHLVHRAMARAFGAMGCEVPPVRLRCRNALPHGRGLGSSSAAIVAGVAAARGLVAGGALLMDDEAVFELAAEIEGHPDNVAPAVFGGFTIAYRGGDRFRTVVLAADPRVAPVVFVPPTPLATSVARGLLPATVPHAEAAATAGRAALLVAALTSRPELLLDATEDWLHQGYRAPAMPGSAGLVAALRADGVPAVVSGAGPTVLALCDPVEAGRVVARAPEGWRALPLAVDLQGVQVQLPG